jgi:hypothetical protein
MPSHEGSGSIELYGPAEKGLNPASRVDVCIPDLGGTACAYATWEHYRWNGELGVGLFASWVIRGAR